jgi:hypothetical protein
MEAIIGIIQKTINPIKEGSKNMITTSLLIRLFGIYNYYTSFTDSLSTTSIGMI